MNVFFGDEQDEPVDIAGLHRFALAVLEAERMPARTEMAVILVSPEQIGEYNREFMGRSGPTDVLAFPLLELDPGVAPVPIANQPPVSLGDVFLCPAEVRRHAAEEGVPFEDYLYLLTVHGILHLLGYDHADDEEASAMEQREEELLGLAGRSL